MKLIKSPCKSICRLDFDSQVCVDCKRTITEIAEWSSYSDEERKEISKSLKYRKMKAIIWSKTSCGFCIMAKQLLEEKNIPYEERNLNKEWTKEQLLESVPDAKTVPQIFLDDKYIGGFTELKSYFKNQ